METVIPRSPVGSGRGAPCGRPEVPLLGRLLAPFGVVYRWRAAMAVDLNQLSEAPRFPDGYTAVSWAELARRVESEELRVESSGNGRPVFAGLSTLNSSLSTPNWLDRLAEIDQRSYAGTIDAALYAHYFRTAAGARRLWQEAMAGRFGRFDGARTLLLMRNGEPCGHVLACLRSVREGFIGDLAVLPEDRGGTGRALLLDCLWRYRRAGVQVVSLAVTLENERAFHLYQSLGFTLRYRFPVMSRRQVLGRRG